LDPARWRGLAAYGHKGDYVTHFFLEELVRIQGRVRTVAFRPRGPECRSQLREGRAPPAEKVLDSHPVTDRERTDRSHAPELDGDRRRLRPLQQPPQGGDGRLRLIQLPFHPLQMGDYRLVAERDVLRLQYSSQLVQRHGQVAEAADDLGRRDLAEVIVAVTRGRVDVARDQHTDLVIVTQRLDAEMRHTCEITDRKADCHLLRQPPRSPATRRQTIEGPRSIRPTSCCQRRNTVYWVGRRGAAPARDRSLPAMMTRAVTGAPSAAAAGSPRRAERKACSDQNGARVRHPRAPPPASPGTPPTSPPREAGFAGTPGSRGPPPPASPGTPPTSPPREAGFAGTPGSRGPPPPASPGTPPTSPPREAGFAGTPGSRGPPPPASPGTPPTWRGRDGFARPECFLRFLASGPRSRARRYIRRTARRPGRQRSRRLRDRSSRSSSLRQQPAEENDGKHEADQFDQGRLERVGIAASKVSEEDRPAHCNAERIAQLLRG